MIYKILLSLVSRKGIIILDMKNKSFGKSLLNIGNIFYKKLRVRGFVMTILLMSVFLGINKNINASGTRKPIKISDVKITIEKAKQTAFGHSKVAPKNARITKIKLEKDNKRFVYRIEFFTEKEKYRYNIDSETGKILSHSKNKREIAKNKDTIDDFNVTPVKKTEGEGKLENTAKYITEERLIEIVTKRITGSEKKDVIWITQQESEGKIIYRGKMIYNNTSYYFEVDALTEEILHWEVNEN